MKKLLFLPLFLLAACSSKFEAVQPTVDNNASELSNRVTTINSGTSFVSLEVPGFESSLPKFTHLVDIASPVVAGNTLQATATLKLDNRLLIAYNTAGAAVSGGIDVVDISNLTAPVLVSSWKSSVYEFNDIKSKGRALYLAGNKKDVGAVMVVMDIADQAHPVVVNEFVLPGQVATSLDVRGDRIFVSSALNGGITRFEVSYNDVLNPTLIRSNPFPNALYVKAVYNPNVAADLEPLVLGGDADTHLYFLDKELPLSAAPSVAPSRIAMQGPMLYINSDTGLKVTEISKFYDGRGFEGFLSSLPLAGNGSGIAELDQRLYVARGTSVRFVNVDEPGAPAELGYLKFDNAGSVNNVWVESYAWNFKVIAVADGAAGVHLVVEDTSAFSNAGDWVKIYAKGTPFQGVNPTMEVSVNGSVVYTTSVLSSTWSIYHINLPAPIPFGAEVHVRFSNDAYQAGVDDRNLSIGYVKIGDDYYYPWWNNYFLDSGVLASPDAQTDNLELYMNGYIKLIR